MVQKWAQAYSSRAPKMKVKQIPRYTSMALMKQLALGSEVRAPIISVVMVRTVVTPGDAERLTVHREITFTGTYASIVLSPKKCQITPHW